MKVNVFKAAYFSRAIFWASMVLVVMCHLISIERIPLPWLDEVHIVEMGRNILDSGHRDYSLLITQDGSFFQPIYYLGPVIQEFAYRTCGRMGPRLSVLLALIIATILCRIWLRRQQLSQGLVTMLSLVFLTYPLLIQSVKIVRVDAWTFIPLFICLLLFGRLSGNQRINQFLFFSIGALAVGMVFIWPSATLFFPLLLLEFVRARERQNFSFGQTSKYIGMGILGALVMAFVLVLPVLDQLGALSRSMGIYFDVTQPGKGVAFELLSKARGLGFLLIKESLRAPFIMLFVVIGFWVQRKDWQFMACFVMALGMALFSGLHTFRFIYLFPFLFVALVLGSCAVYKRHAQIATALLVSTVLYGIVSGGIAYAAMTPALKGRSYSELRDNLRLVIGEGPKRVYLHNLQAYYVARELQWHYYRYGQGTLINIDVNAARILARTDYVAEMKQAPVYAVEESFTFYGGVRDYLIRAAIKEATNPHQGLAARIGSSMAFRSPSRQEQEEFNQLLKSSGFQQYCASDLATKPREYSAWQLKVRSWMAVPPDYDLPVVWVKVGKTD